MYSLKYKFLNRIVKLSVSEKLSMRILIVGSILFAVFCKLSQGQTMKNDAYTLGTFGESQTTNIKNINSFLQITQKLAHAKRFTWQNRYMRTSSVHTTFVDPLG